MSNINEEEATTSVGNVETYPNVMLKTALKRNNFLSVGEQEYKAIKSMSETDIVSKYNLKTPCLINNGKNFLLVSNI
jgi:hypothetical protein